jgi:nucleoside transporter
MASRVRGRLAVMMALIYAVQGAWWPLLAVHLKDLGIDGRGRGWIFATAALAALATPLGAGQIADRYLSAQRLLALIYALGTGLLVLQAGGAVTGAASLFVLFLVYWLLTVPVAGLGNALAFRNLEQPESEFGGVRLWGTVGWMGVGWLVTVVMAWHGSIRAGQGAFEAFWVAATFSAVLAAYALTLPDTPPLARGGRSIDLDEARALLRRPGVAVFLLCAFGVSLSTPFVYQTVPPYLPTLGLPRSRVAAAMTLGQVPEVVSLAALPWVLHRLGQRWTLALGIFAWVGYYGVMAARPPLWFALLGLPLNGVAIALFHIAGPMFLDSQAPTHRRSSVQGLYVMITTGVGSLLGNLLAGEITRGAPEIGAVVFRVPLGINLVMLVAFLATFRPRARPLDWPEGASPRPRPLAESAVQAAG